MDQNGLTANYTYGNSAGDLTAVSYPGHTDQNVTLSYDGDSPLVEMDASGNYKAEFLYGPAGLISHYRAGLGTVFFTFDERGSVKSQFSSTGSLQSLVGYDSYGALTPGSVYVVGTEDP